MQMLCLPTCYSDSFDLVTGEVQHRVRASGCVTNLHGASSARDSAVAGRGGAIGVDTQNYTLSLHKCPVTVI